MSKIKVDPCGVCSFSSVLCVQCGKWIHGRRAGVKRVTPTFSRNLTCRECKGNILETVEQKEKIREGRDVM